MLDWGIGLAVGVGAAIASEVALLTAIITPKFPIHKGRTWRGTFYGVTTLSAVVGVVAGYIALQFGGRGGGGTTAPGDTQAQTTRSEPAPVKATKVDTAPQKPDSYLASYVDVYFLRNEQTKLVENFACELAVYRLRDKKWNLEIQQIKGKDLRDFEEKFVVAIVNNALEMAPDEKVNRRLRIYLTPFPGEGVYDQIKKDGEARGWKVDRKDGPWQAELPAS